MRMRQQGSPVQRVEVNMTPMIDVVFQLLAFFVMSFKIVQAEGDLTLQMPIEPSTAAIDPHPFLPPLQVRLAASAQGELASIELGGQPVGDLTQLRQEVRTIVAGERELAGDLRVNLICDDALHYKHVVAALTAVSGERQTSGEVLPLAKNVQIQRAN